jgi:hypothetical protein
MVEVPIWIFGVIAFTCTIIGGGVALFAVRRSLRLK